MTKEYNFDDHFKIITVGFEKTEEPETYTITRLESWSAETWAEVIDAVEDTTASFGEEE